jgi:hypothetical protein
MTFRKRYGATDGGEGGGGGEDIFLPAKLWSGLEFSLYTPFPGIS